MEKSQKLRKLAGCQKMSFDAEIGYFGWISGPCKLFSKNASRCAKSLGQSHINTNLRPIEAKPHSMGLNLFRPHLAVSVAGLVHTSSLRLTSFDFVH